jgi:hypothetical protein
MGRLRRSAQWLWNHRASKEMRIAIVVAFIGSGTTIYLALFQNSEPIPVSHASIVAKAKAERNAWVIRTVSITPSLTPSGQIQGYTLTGSFSGSTEYGEPFIHVLALPPTTSAAPTSALVGPSAAASHLAYVGDEVSPDAQGRWTATVPIAVNEHRTLTIIARLDLPCDIPGVVDCLRISDEMEKAQLRTDGTKGAAKLSRPVVVHP